MSKKILSIIIGLMLIFTLSFVTLVVTMFISPNYKTISDEKIEGTDGVVYNSESIKINFKDPTYNKQIECNNMLPGDSFINYYSVSVAHKDDIILYFNIDYLLDNYLSDVLNLEIIDINNNVIVYNGKFNDFETVSFYLQNVNKEKINTIVNFSIKYSLDTSVGNEFQNKEIDFDYNWTVNDVDLLCNNHQIGFTGGTFYVVSSIIVSVLLCFNLAVLTIVLLKNKKGTIS